jgi:hypothetical protein
MPWDPAYVAWLKTSPIYPVHVLETIEIGSFGPTNTPLKLSSAWVSDEHVVAIVREGSSIEYGQIRPGTYERSYGSATIEILPGVDIRASIARGMVCCLRVGPAGLPLSEVMHPHVWLGVIRDYVCRSGRWYLELTELIGGLQNRFTDSADQQSLFYSLSSTTLSVEYDPEADNSITVADTTVLLTTGETDYYLVQIVPSDGGEPFYLLGQTVNSGAGTLTTLTEDLYGTTAIAAPAGSTVKAIGYMSETPMRCAARILLSNLVPRNPDPGDGAYTNGPYDLLPEGWGYAIPQYLFDGADMEAFIDIVHAGFDGVDDTWQVVVESPQTDGLQWLQEFLRPGGFFLGLHQGSLTVRAVVRDVGLNTPGTITVDDELIVDVVEYHAWDPDSPVEYRTARTVAADGTASTSTETHIGTRPSRTRRRRDLLDCWKSTADWTNEVSERLGPYDTRVPERIVVETRGWAAAQPSIGDLVRLTTSVIPRRTVEADPVFAATPALMVGGGCNWFGGTCRLELLAIPRFPEVE